ncbi:hypothetical protein Taro_031639 [Colocasia esculenta]|uniref:Carbohydrate kinase PfkB domain-containing protein n=1 Tax=Colocasia esculenta TaxID=4460 RepID=A0A843VJB1_COLES|nr:hypothetical protein [Colocasia esculenta]
MPLQGLRPPSHHSPFAASRAEAADGRLRRLPLTRPSRAAASLHGAFSPAPGGRFSPRSGNRRGVVLVLSLQNRRWDQVEADAGEGNGNGRPLKSADVATLGNLCVDIVLNVPTLPPAPREERKAYLERLSASPPDERFWEAGGNCNLAIAASRLGLNCIALGHVGDEMYGRFLQSVLQKEGIGMVGMNEDTKAAGQYSALYETLLCWVLVDPFQRHGFCSRADFTQDPAFSWMKELTKTVQLAIKQSKILFCNGYVFDELSPDLIVSALDCAISAGTTVFFDPGPRGRSLSTGTPEERRALELYLKLSDVLLLTSDEAESLTGVKSPVLAGQELIRKGTRTKWVVIKMGARGSILITKSSISCAPAFKVSVLDTVGCGDSFTAAIAFGYLQNMPKVNTLALANAVGAATATGCGAGRNVANLDKVLELLRLSNLNDDHQFWNDLLEGVLEMKEISILSRFFINGRNDHLSHVSVQKVMSELIHKFKKEECVFLKGSAQEHSWGNIDNHRNKLPEILDSGS